MLTPREFAEICGGLVDCQTAWLSTPGKEHDPAKTYIPAQAIVHLLLKYTDKSTPSTDAENVSKAQGEMNK